MLRVRPLHIRLLAILGGVASALSDDEGDPTRGAWAPSTTETAEP
jgi:hypothetical protein